MCVFVFLKRVNISVAYEHVCVCVGCTLTGCQSLNINLMTEST